MHQYLYVCTRPVVIGKSQQTKKKLPSTCLPRNLPCLVFESSNTFLTYTCGKLAKRRLLLANNNLRWWSVKMLLGCWATTKKKEDCCWPTTIFFFLRISILLHILHIRLSMPFIRHCPFHYYNDIKDHSTSSRNRKDLDRHVLAY